MQQAPGEGQLATAQVTPAPAQFPEAAVQAALVRNWQLRLDGMQQAPPVWQLTESNGTLSPWYVPPAAVQANCVAAAQLPSVRQHAPVAAGMSMIDSTVPLATALAVLREYCCHWPALVPTW